MNRGGLVILLLLLLCGFGFLCLQMIEHPSLLNLKYSDYISLVSSIVSIFVALVFVLEYCHIQKPEKDLQQEARKLTFADQHHDYGHLLHEKGTNDPHLFSLYAEMNSHYPELQMALLNGDTQKIKEIHTVQLVLQQIENIVIHHGGLKGFQRELTLRKEQQLRVWKRYFKSKIVLHHYEYLSQNLGLDTNLFIQLYLLPPLE